MKKAILVFSVVLSFLSSAKAQWYERSCGVNDLDGITIQEFGCLWERASHNIQVGKITTIAGTIATVTGIIWGSQAYDMAVILPLAIMTVGLITLSIGLPIWITGYNRKFNLKENPHYKNLNIGSLKVAPSIIRNQFINTYSVGLTASLRF